MPSIKEILVKEREKKAGTVVLIEEGLFFKAYEESACRLAQQYGLKVSCRMVKTVGEMVASVGFPKTSVTKYLPKYVQTDEFVEAEGITECAMSFLEWKQAVEQQALFSTRTVISQMQDWLAEAVRSYPVERKTPVECMLFLMELKTKLTNGKS